MAQDHIRNFSIIAHIDHGKSTLADRILELTHAVADRDMREQLLDSMDLERERGITIKAQAVASVEWKGHQLNLIDTPGPRRLHLRGLALARRPAKARCSSSTPRRASQAQTLANAYLAIENNLEIVPVVNKIDLPQADPDGAARRDRGPDRRRPGRTSCGSRPRRAWASRTCSTRSSSGSRRRRATPTRPPRALIFDSSYDQYRGVVAFVRVVDGALRDAGAAARDGARHALRGRGARLLRAGPHEPATLLEAGEVGYVITGLKDVSQAAGRRHAHVRAAARPRSRCRATRT